MTDYKPTMQTNPGHNTNAVVEGQGKGSTPGMVSQRYAHLQSSGTWGTVSMKVSDSEEQTPSRNDITFTLAQARDLAAKLLVMAAIAEYGIDTTSFLDLHIEYGSDLKATLTHSTSEQESGNDER